MNYFIESVNVYSTTGKSKKGAALQNVVKQYEHHLFDGDSISALINSLKILVDVCNRTLPGQPLILSTTTDKNNGGGHIACSDGKATGTDVFSINYAPIDGVFRFSHVRDSIYEALADGENADLARGFVMACNEISRKEGGDND